MEIRVPSASFTQRPRHRQPRGARAPSSRPVSRVSATITAVANDHSLCSIACALAFRDAEPAERVALLFGCVTIWSQARGTDGATQHRRGGLNNSGGCSWIPVDCLIAMEQPALIGHPGKKAFSKRHFPHQKHGELEVYDELMPSRVSKKFCQRLAKPHNSQALNAPPEERSERASITGHQSIRAALERGGQDRNIRRIGQLRPVSLLSTATPLASWTRMIATVMPLNRSMEPAGLFRAKLAINAQPRLLFWIQRQRVAYLPARGAHLQVGWSWKFRPTAVSRGLGWNPNTGHSVIRWR